MIDGILNVYKESGFTSHDVVAKLRGILRQKKIGHTGTLDPEASGVLPVCLGKGTKLCDMLTDRDKVYEAQMILGIATDTLDMSGQVLKSEAVDLSPDEITAAVDRFVGCYEQIPPMYSALKVGGRKLCDLARAGIEVERKPRLVEIYSIDIKEIVPYNDHKISVLMKVHCSKGTYIRSLCDDIGQKLGCPAAMGSLLRTVCAGFKLEDALKLSEIESLVRANEIEKYVVPVEMAFQTLPGVYMKADASRFLYNGNPFELNNVQKVSGILSDGCSVRVYDHDGSFLAVYSYSEKDQKFRTIKMFL